MKIALLQLDFLVGDIEGNRDKILDAIENAVEVGADICITSELAICGYPPKDLLLLNGFIERCHVAINDIAMKIKGRCDLVIGTPYVKGNRLYNTALLIQDGKISHIFGKSLLPIYDIFDEERYFDSLPANEVIEYRGKKLLFTICEDIWDEVAHHDTKRYDTDPLIALKQNDVDILINLSASPYSMDKIHQRRDILSTISNRYSCVSIYVNQVGSNDGIVFDGASCMYGSNGEMLAMAHAFEDDVLCVDTETGHGRLEKYPDAMESTFRALTLGLRDYIHKCGFKKVVLGLSGGIDSALVAVLAKEALGAENVTCLLLSSPYTSPESVEDAVQLAQNINVIYHELKISDLMNTYDDLLAPVFQGTPADVTEENIQSRIRGTTIMAVANKFSALGLATGNKTELAVGYCTIYGDMAGALAVIGDLYKTVVFDMCRWINKTYGEVIPPRIITKPPTAELRENQKDSDSLPEYDILDGILKMRIECNKDLDEIIAMGYEKETVQKVFRLLHISEFKRFQAAPVIKVTDRAFGDGWRIPIAKR